MTERALPTELLTTDRIIIFMPISSKLNFAQKCCPQIVKGHFCPHTILFIRQPKLNKKVTNKLCKTKHIIFVIRLDFGSINWVLSNLGKFSGVKGQTQNQALNGVSIHLGDSGFDRQQANIVRLSLDGLDSNKNGV
jgi:hypothetical protein